MRRWPLATILVVLLHGAPSVAQSRPASSASHAPSPPGLSDALKGSAKADYEAAKLLFADGDFAGAQSKFRQAYETSKDPRLLWNMAVCEKNQRHYYRVQTLANQYLVDGKGILTAEQQTQAEELLVAIKSFVASMKVTANEDGATIAIDGQPVGTTPLPAPLPIDLGPRKVTISKPGFTSETRELDVAGGTEMSIDAKLHPVVVISRLAINAGSGDAIALDGKVVGSGHWEGTLVPGPHVIRVTGTGKKPFDQRLALEGGATRTVDVTLEAEASKRQIWLYVAGGVVLAAGLSIGGYFLFKPEDKQVPTTPGTLAPGIITLGAR